LTEGVKPRTEDLTQELVGGTEKSPRCFDCSAAANNTECCLTKKKKRATCGSHTVWIRDGEQIGFSKKNGKQEG